ncbi:hypothetical protein ABLN87_15395 [Ruegeria sp. SCPT10]|uniref:hypothetical protein n=1 Tax=Ruegeria sp. SCP10 TaxID=3141377 RepID=UPI0033351D86
MTDIQKTLHLAGKAVEMCLNGRPSLALRRFNAHRARLSPWDVARIDPQLRRVHRDAEFQGSRKPGVVTRILRLKPPFFEQEIARSPQTAWLFVHSHNGRYRQSAVQSMIIGDEDTAAQTALLQRCNDWVPQVREAAFDRLRTRAPQLSQTALASLVVFAVARVGIWQRGGAEALNILRECPLWLSALEEALAKQTNGPLVHVLKRQIVESALDHALNRLARSARSPFVRSAATECVLNEQVRWKSGYAKQWVNKPLGISRRVPIFKERVLDIDPANCAAVVRSGARDASAMVRKKIADKFIRDGGKEFSDEVKLLSKDSAASVRSRMEFFHRKYPSNMKKDKVND